MQGCHQTEQPLDHAEGAPEVPASRLLLGQEVRPMSHGKIVKLVRTFGSSWGRIQPTGQPRDIFFNRSSLPDDTDFAELREGQIVQFDEEPDRGNGTRAVRIILTDVPQAIDRK
jgi:cold shock CspA family protein